MTNLIHNSPSADVHVANFAIADLPFRQPDLLFAGVKECSLSNLLPACKNYEIEFL